MTYLVVSQPEVVSEHVQLVRLLHSYRGVLRFRARDALVALLSYCEKMVGESEKSAIVFLVDYQSFTRKYVP